MIWCVELVVCWVRLVRQGLCLRCVSSPRLRPEHREDDFYRSKKRFDDYWLWTMNDLRKSG